MDTQLGTPITAKLGQLHFKNELRWSPLPIWARFFLTLGSVLARYREEKIRYVAALALPTRSYAAALIGSGLAYTNSFLHSNESTQHLELILSLPNGTLVKYLSKKGRLLNGIKREVIDYEGKLTIGIQKGSIGKETIYVAATDASRIEILDKNYLRLPKQQIGRDIHPPSPLLAEMLGDQSYEYLFQTKIDGLVIGSCNALKEDAEALIGAKPANGLIQEGYLFELFRVKGFNSASTGHRFLIQAPTSQETIELPEHDSQSRAVIFDGSLSFTKWKECYRNQNWIVILDHTEPNFANAVSQINQEYIYRSDHAVKISIPPLPSGIELMLFARDL